MSDNNNVLTQEQLQKLADVLTQYVPEGWQTVQLGVDFDEERAKFITWATTLSDNEYGFIMDDDDYNDIADLLINAIKGNGNIWNAFKCCIKNNGDCDAEFKITDGAKGE